MSTPFAADAPSQAAAPVPRGQSIRVRRADASTMGSSSARRRAASGAQRTALSSVFNPPEPGAAGVPLPTPPSPPPQHHDLLSPEDLGASTLASGEPAPRQRRAPTISWRLTEDFISSTPVSEFGRPRAVTFVAPAPSPSAGALGDRPQPASILGRARSGSSAAASTARRPRSGTAGSGSRPGSAGDREISPPPSVQVRIVSPADQTSQSSKPPSAVGDGSTSPVVGNQDATIASRGRSSTFRGRRRAGSMAVSDTVREDREGTDHDSHEVDLLEVVDPAVQTAATLSQIQTAIFSPHLPLMYLNRQPVVRLEVSPPAVPSGDLGFPLPSAMAEAGAPGQPVSGPGKPYPDTEEDAETASVTESELLLDEHVKDRVLKRHQRKEQLRRVWHGFVAFAKTPLGVLAIIYGVLVVIFGAALVLVLMMSSVFKNHHTYQIWVEVCSQVLNGLFTIPGLGLLPGRIVDWWHGSIICHYARVTYRRRERRHLAPLPDRNDLPDPSASPAGATEDEEKRVGDAACNPRDTPSEGSSGGGRGRALPVAAEEALMAGRDESVLTERELAKLRHAQAKLCARQTWYRPHATPTHRAFPIVWTAVVLGLNLGNSLFQCGMCGVMWGLRYYNRPAWTTGILLPLSFLCGVGSGICIWRIGKRTLKTEEVVGHVEAVMAEEKEEERLARR